MRCQNKQVLYFFIKSDIYKNCFNSKKTNCHVGKRKLDQNFFFNFCQCLWTRYNFWLSSHDICSRKRLKRVQKSKTILAHSIINMCERISLEMLTLRILLRLGATRGLVFTHICALLQPYAHRHIDRQWAILLRRAGWPDVQRDVERISAGELCHTCKYIVRCVTYSS